MRYLWLPLLFGCQPPCYQDSGRIQYSDLPVHVTAYSPGGIQLDDPRYEFDAGSIDSTVAATVECLQQFVVAPADPR